MLTVAGLFGAILMSLFVDKTKLFSETLKFMAVSSAAATILFAAVSVIIVNIIHTANVYALVFTV